MKSKLVYSGDAKDYESVAPVVNSNATGGRGRLTRIKTRKREWLNRITQGKPKR